MKKVALSILLTIIAILICSNSCHAVDFDPNSIEPLKIDSSLADKLGGVIGIVQLVGTAIAVIGVIYLGSRYMIASIEEKADIKKKAIPYIIGTVIFFGATGILRLIASVAGWF